MSEKNDKKKITKEEISEQVDKNARKKLTSGESSKSRKKRLTKQTDAAKSARKPSNKPAQEASAEEVSALGSTDDTTINRMIELGLPIPEATRPEPKTRKKAAAPKRARGPIIGTPLDTAPKTGSDYRDDNKEKNVAFEESQKERAEGEVGGVAALGEEASFAEKEARSQQLAKYQEQIKEVPSSTVPKNEGTVDDDPLRPKQVDKFVPPTAAEAARSASRPARGGGGTGVYTFDAAEGAPVRKETDVANLRSSREAKGLPGLPGDERGVNELALTLAQRDYDKAKETGKVVNEMDPTGDKPTAIDQIYNGHHRRLADVLIEGNLTEDQIRRHAEGSGATFHTKVHALWNTLKEHRAAQASAGPVDLEKEGITHWIHPRTGEALPISANHPDMPKQQPVGLPGGEDVNHGFWRAGVSKRVRRDENTGAPVVDARTGNSEVDASLGWDPDKPVGWVPFTLKGGTRALKQNFPPSNSVSQWQSEVRNIKSDFPMAPSQDSRLQHKARATRWIEDAERAEAKGKVIARNKKGEPIPRMKRRTGKIMGIYNKTGRTQPAGFTTQMQEGGDPLVTDTVATSTSRARVNRPDTIGTTGREYNPGGSILVTEGSEIPEVTKTVEFTPKINRPKKWKIQNGKRVVNPSVVGVSGGGGVLGQKTEPAFIPVTDHNKGQQFLGPQPKWDRPNVIGENEPGVSTAEPITRGSPEITRVKKSKRSKKTKLVTTPGMVDQTIPGFENVDLKDSEKKPFTEAPAINIVEGPITSAQASAEKTAPYLASSSKTRKATGRVTVSTRSTTSARRSTPAVSTQLAKIAGNSPVDLPVSSSSAPAAPRQNAEQLMLPGMEGPDNVNPHAEGNQWVKNRDLSPETRRLQGTARNVRTNQAEPEEDTRPVAQKFETPTDKIMRGVREKKSGK